MSINRQVDKNRISIDQQLRIAEQLDEQAKREPIIDTVLYKHTPGLSLIPLSCLYFLSWRAGFRGYSLQKYGKGRIMTILPGLIFPFNGYMCHERVHKQLTEPFRIESGWNYAWKHALAHQVGVITTTLGSIMLTFIISHAAGLLPIPDGMHKPGVREVATGILYSRVKRYTKPIAVSAAASTVLMFFVGYGSYVQSCNLLAKIGRKSLSKKEDTQL